MVPGQLYTVPAGVAHVRSQLKDRAVTLTFERIGMSTERSRARRRVMPVSSRSSP